MPRLHIILDLPLEDSTGQDPEAIAEELLYDALNQAQRYADAIKFSIVSVEWESI